MSEAVIVSTARTPIGRAFRGAFNQTHGAVISGHVISHAVKRAGVEPEEVEDVIFGCGYPEGATGKNIARLAAFRAAGIQLPSIRPVPVGDQSYVQAVRKVIETFA